jgi:hypothetical protein
MSDVCRRHEGRDEETGMYAAKSLLFIQVSKLMNELLPAIPC